MLCPRSLQITRIGTTYKASLLGPALQFLMTIRLMIHVLHI
jgi:hypothetical protein